MRTLLGLSPQILGGGSIVARQTTFWDLRTMDGSNFRVHFRGKREFGFFKRSFVEAELAEQHPLLIEYQSRSDQLYVWSVVAQPDALLAELRSLAASHFGKWRPLERYLNDQCPADDVLVGGYGVLLNGPTDFIRDAEGVCIRWGVKCSVHGGPQASEQLLRALTLGRNFVIARDFDVASIAPATA